MKDGSVKIDRMTAWFGIFWSVVLLFGGMGLESVWLLTLAGVTFFVYIWLIIGTESGKAVLVLLFIVLNGMALVVEVSAFLLFIAVVQYMKLYSSRFVPSSPESVALHLAFILVDVIFSAFVQYIVYGAYKLRNPKVKPIKKTVVQRF